VGQLIWTPGAPGPLDEFVGRLTRMVREFATEHGVDAAEVRIELVDGRHYLLATAAPEPGFGFFCIVPHREEGEGPQQVIIPVGAVKLIEISVPDPEAPFGFTAPAD
jgi:hypothetical protein